MDKRKRLEELNRKIQRIESGWIAHNDVPGHPELCSEATIIIRTWDCLLGSDESAINMRVDYAANLSPRQHLTAMRRAVRWMEYDLMLRERAEIVVSRGETEENV